MEELIDIIPSPDDSTRMELWKHVDEHGERRLEIRFAVFHDDLGWTVQRRLQMGDAEAAALRAAIGMGGFTGESTRRSRIAQIKTRHGNVVSLDDARRLIG